MTAEERFLFDLQGFLLIKNAIAPEVLGAMNTWLDEQAARDPRWQGQTANAHLENILTWGPMFRDLLDNPRVFPILKDLLGNKLRLDHDYGIFLRPGHSGLKLHGPNFIPFDPCHYYHCSNGKISCGLTVAAYALNDVPPGAGGFAVIAGSHKCNFDCPKEIKTFERASSIVQQVPIQAGDCIVFTEALIHGTFPWKGPGVRRTLFFKYAPSNLAWEKRTYFPHAGNAAIQSITTELTETQRALLDPPSAVDFHRAL